MIRLKVNSQSRINNGPAFSFQKIYTTLKLKFEPLKAHWREADI
jgi:hypothetical protein